MIFRIIKEAKVVKSDIFGIEIIQEDGIQSG